MNFSTMGLSEPILKAVHASGYSSPTEIQSAAIPSALKGQDILGCAPTGTGKTAAFVLPILHRLAGNTQQKGASRYPRALVLTPTRELAQQIDDAARVYGKFTYFRSIAAYGGVNIQNQIRNLRRGVDIVIATPGRLLDLIDRRCVDLSKVEILVLDEADRMYDMGFIRDVKRIISHVPRERQTMLFSATMSGEIRRLVAGIQNNPKRIEIGEINTPVETVTQVAYTVPQRSKTDLLVHMLRKEQVETMLVFSRTRHGADRIARVLDRSGIRSSVIHSDRSQAQRTRALDGFKQRKFQVLVATDLAARGIDIDSISHVVNYDTPVYAEDYIHRIGRTGRAQAEGTAVTFVSNDEEKYLRRIEMLTSKRIRPQIYEGFNYPEPPRPVQKPAPLFSRPIRRTRRMVRFA